VQAAQALNAKQIPLCVPRPRKCSGKEKARDSVRDDTEYIRASYVAATDKYSGTAASPLRD